MAALHTMKTQAPEMRPSKVKEPWELVGVDLIGENHICERCYQVLGLGFFSKWYKYLVSKKVKKSYVHIFPHSLTHRQNS